MRYANQIRSAVTAAAVRTRPRFWDLLRRGLGGVAW
jgi:hypothetical protein